jgi:hypothetical protein
MTAMVVQNRLHAPPRQICNVLWIICTVCSSNTSTCVYTYHPLVCITFYSATWHCIGIYIYMCVIMGHHEHLNLRRKKQHLHTWQLKKQLWNPGRKHRSKITTSPQKMLEHAGWILRPVVGSNSNIWLLNIQRQQKNPGMWTKTASILTKTWFLPRKPNSQVSSGCLA